MAIFFKKKQALAGFGLIFALKTIIAEVREKFKPFKVLFKKPN